MANKPIIRRIKDARGERWVADVYGSTSLHRHSTSFLYSSFVISYNKPKATKVVSIPVIGTKIVMEMSSLKYRVSFRGYYIYFSDSLEDCKNEVLSIIKTFRMEPVRRSIK